MILARKNHQEIYIGLLMITRLAAGLATTRGVETGLDETVLTTCLIAAGCFLEPLLLHEQDTVLNFNYK